MNSHKKLSEIKRQQIIISPLANHSAWLELVLEWQKKDSPGLMAAGEDELNDIRQHQEDFYIIEYGAGIFKQAVGTFKLYDHPIDACLQEKLGDKRLRGVKGLDYFYIIDKMRGQGIGGMVMQKIRDIAKNLHAEIIVFDTITPRLNAFYTRCGAKVVSDNWFLGSTNDKYQSSTFMRMDV